MLDVHSPHTRIEGLKDFLLHLFTITIGLLIALGLEGCVERHQKAELRREAETNLRQEMRDNRQKLTDWRTLMKTEEGNLRSVMDFLAAREEGKPFDVRGIQLGYGIRELSDASWRTATATGALSLMEYGRVQQYAGLYQVQGEVMDLERESLEDFLNLQSYTAYRFDPDKVTAAQAAAREPDVRRALAHLEAMDEVAVGLSQAYDKALTGDK